MYFGQRPQGAPFDGQRRPTSQDVKREIDAISANPAQFIEPSGMNIPQEMQNDPRSMCVHLINSGQVPQARLRFAQPLINRLMGHR